MGSYNYSSKEALKEAILAKYLLLDGEFMEIQENQKHIRFAGIDRTPAEILAYQIGWLKLVMSWEPCIRISMLLPSNHFALN